jgi:hypothetical protein
MSKNDSEYKTVPPHEDLTRKGTFRVRDKYEEGKPPKIWGDGLSWEAAHRVKERVTGDGRSTSARVEPMAAPFPLARERPVANLPSGVMTADSAPNPDPDLEAVRQKGMAAGRGQIRPHVPSLVSVPSQPMVRGTNGVDGPAAEYHIDEARQAVAPPAVEIETDGDVEDIPDNLAAEFAEDLIDDVVP